MTIDFIIEKLNTLLIKQEFNDRKGKVAYITKADAYRDVIKLFKEIKKIKIKEEI